ncbi:MAG: hypothetical protein RR365_08915 [Bacteroides sp.]
MKKQFADLVVYIRLYDGYGKPRLDWQTLYKLFPKFEFIASHDFGSYENFGEAFEQKVYDMTVRDADGNECSMVYREYHDAIENRAYVS